MGNYINPGNEGFKAIRKGIYVDKSMLIDFVNSTIDISPDRMTCFSRPRRFGKSYTAKMLCAYYDRSCDSRELFDDLMIAGSDSYEEYLNQYDVLYLDITWFISRARSSDRNIVANLQTAVIRELQEMFPGCVREGETYLPDAMLSVVRKSGRKFVVIIDEWDALFREAKDDQSLQRDYVQLLRGLFKGGPITDKIIAAAYMTGILPIKKYGTQSALTDFREFTMVDPLILSPYLGFTESEVQALCDSYDVDFGRMKQWYDGYSFEDVASVYSPNSVMNAIKFKKFKNYWTSSETWESLKEYISMNFDGLRDSVIAMLGGRRVLVDTLSFQNDMVSFHGRDDVLTLLIHLGYLAYDSGKHQAYIPNLEVAESFKLAVQNSGWSGVNTALRESELLLNMTIEGNEDAVAAALESVHSAETSILQYNDENSLSCAVTIAYYTARNYYTIIRELPAGKGFADLAFIPFPYTDKPAMLVELKCDKSADGAIQQIKEKRYDGALKAYVGNLLLVGINYDKATKIHFCVIEKW
ncbi:MAG: ATP-binding protein [Lachnospiraceae bacterium]|nr:ATP-binding protein [Lachnospiraceae bacterium]